MALINSFVFTKTVIDADALLKAMHNQFRVASVRPFVDKKGILANGLTLTLNVLYDDFDYGVDKKTGQPRDNNLYQNFDVTVLDRSQPVKKGDFISLGDFDAENSFAIGFDLLLRFKSLRILQPKPQTQPTQPTIIAKNV